MKVNKMPGRKKSHPRSKSNNAKRTAGTVKGQARHVHDKGMSSFKSIAMVKKQVKIDKEAMKIQKAAARVALKLKTQKAALHQKEREMAMKSDNDRQQVEVLLANAVFSDFISKNVGKKAINIIRMLNIPQTDEKLAADLNIKINEVRRILNVLDSYGVARYDTNKDSKGWLTFKWYLNHSRLMELNTDIMTRKPEDAYRLPEDCNDFFYCNSCYDEQKVILPFDAAYENQFKCDNCGKNLKQLSKTEAQSMFNESMAEEEKTTVTE